MYNLLHKDDSGFVISKAMDRVIYTLSFSWKDQSIRLTRQIGNGKEIDITCEEYLNLFFHKNEDEKMIEMISTAKNIDAHRYALSLGKYDSERAQKLGRGLKRILRYPEMQIVNAAGITGRNFREACYVIKNQRGVKPATTAHEILGLSRAMFNLFRDNDLKFDSWTLRQMKKLEEYITMNNVIMICDIFKDEGSLSQISSCVDNIVELYTQFGYTDLRRLAVYLARDVKLQQGIRKPSEAIGLLKDYNKMATVLQYEIEKYPKSLKKVHDITTMNYEANKDEIKNQQVQMAAQEPAYSKLQCTKKEFAVILPQGVSDIIKEGEVLGHCVASYVDDVVERKCQIAFLRKKDNLDEPLVTIEVRNNAVRQARRKGNREPLEDEMAFLKEWAQEKELQYALQY